MKNFYSTLYYSSLYITIVLASHNGHSSGCAKTNDNLFTEPISAEDMTRINSLVKDIKSEFTTIFNERPLLKENNDQNSTCFDIEMFLKNMLRLFCEYYCDSGYAACTKIYNQEHDTIIEEELSKIENYIIKSVKILRNIKVFNLIDPEYKKLVAIYKIEDVDHNRIIDANHFDRLNFEIKAVINDLKEPEHLKNIKSIILTKIRNQEQNIIKRKLMKVFFYVLNAYDARSLLEGLIKFNMYIDLFYVEKSILNVRSIRLKENNIKKELKYLLWCCKHINYTEDFENVMNEYVLATIKVRAEENTKNNILYHACFGYIIPFYIKGLDFDSFQDLCTSDDSYNYMKNGIIKLILATFKINDLVVEIAELK